MHALSNRSIGTFRIPYDLWKLQSVLWLSWKFRTGWYIRPLTGRGYFMADRQYQLVTATGVHPRTETIIILMGWELPINTFCLLVRLRYSCQWISHNLRERTVVIVCLSKSVYCLVWYRKLYTLEISQKGRFVGFSVTHVSFSVRQYPFLTTTSNNFLLFKGFLLQLGKITYGINIACIWCEKVRKEYVWTNTDKCDLLWCGICFALCGLCAFPASVIRQKRG